MGAVDIVGPVAPPGHARGLGNAGVYTNRRKWPLGAVLGHLCTLLRLARVMRAAVGAQECTQIGGNGLSELFWGICVHCCDLRGSCARPGERRSVHRSAEMASRGRFGAFVYTVATREGHARVAPPLGWRLCRGSNPHKPPRSPLWRLDNKYRDPSAQGSVAFGSSGASGASRDAPGSLSGPYRTTSTTLSHRTYPAHMRAKRTIVETLLSTLNLMNSQNPRWRSVQSLRAMLAPLPCEVPLADSV